MIIVVFQQKPDGTFTTLNKAYKTVDGAKGGIPGFGATDIVTRYDDNNGNFAMMVEGVLHVAVNVREAAEAGLRQVLALAE